MGTPEVVFDYADIGHAEALAKVMRKEDAEELLASGYETPLDGLIDALDKSDVACTAFFDGEVAAMWGVGPVGQDHTLLGKPDVGVAWLLTGRAVTKYPRAFVRACKEELPKLFEHYGAIANFVDTRYAAAIRWARWLGFDCGNVAPFGPNGVPFQFISMRRPHGRVR